MTVDEAIRHLYTYSSTNGSGQTTQEQHEEAKRMAIDALKKQIPMKPIGEHYAHMRCPSCEHRIPSGMGSSSRRRDNWCNYCGQAIDWNNSK